MFPGCYGDGKPKIESCIACCEPTGRAGKGEDSIYFGDVGPFCESCKDDIQNHVESERLAAAEAERDSERVTRQSFEARLAVATQAGTPYAAERDSMNALIVENQQLNERLGADEAQQEEERLRLKLADAKDFLDLETRREAIASDTNRRLRLELAEIKKANERLRTELALSYGWGLERSRQKRREIDQQLATSQDSDEDHILGVRKCTIDAKTVTAARQRLAEESRTPAPITDWRVHLIQPEEGEPFGVHVECEVVDIGYSDKVLVVKVKQEGGEA